MEQLTEDDIPGAGLGNRDPKHLTNKELRFWFSCRGLSSSKLKTKAELIAQIVKMKDEDLQIIDPTPQKLYTKRKSCMDASSAQPSSSDSCSIRKPVEGWKKIIPTLSDFSELNILAYGRLSGKKVDRSSSTFTCNVTQQTCQRPEQRGFQFYFEGYVHDVWASSKDEKVFFKAKCFKSQKTKDNPHELWCAISCISPCDAMHAYCTCVAGKSGFCNHVFALLYQISHYCKFDLNEIPSATSKTSLPQQWDKPRKRGVTADPVMDIVHQKATTNTKRRKVNKCNVYEARQDEIVANDDRRIACVQSEYEELNPILGLVYMINEKAEIDVQTTIGTFVPLGSYLSFQINLTEGDSDVSYIKETVERHPCTSNCSIGEYPALPFSLNSGTFSINGLKAEHLDFFQDVILTPNQATEIEEQTRHQTSCLLWWQARDKRLTASDFAKICKRISGSAKLVERLVSDRFKNKESQGQDIPSSKSMRGKACQHGHQHEETAARKYYTYMGKTGHPVEVLPAGFVVNPTIPFLGCSPDRRILDKQSHPHFGLLEIKCPYKHRDITPQDAAKSDKEFCLKYGNDQLFLPKTHDYYYQVQGQLAVTGLKWCDFVVFTFKGLHIERIYADTSFWDEAVAKLEIFYFEQFVPQYLKKMAEKQQANIVVPTL